MPRVDKVKARKDYPRFGIVKGQEHYQWKIKQTYGGIEYRSAIYPRRSQLTASAFYGPLYDIFDEQVAKAESADDIRACAEAIRELGSEQQEKFDNMPEGLQQGSTGELLEQRANGCETVADELDQIADTLEQALDDLQAEEDDTDRHNALEAWAMYDADYAAWEEAEEDTPEPSEPSYDRPDERDFEDERNTLIQDALSELGDKESECENG